MSIWEFGMYDNNELREISSAVEVLANYGLEPSEDAVRELYNEIDKREEKGEIVR